MEFRKQKNTTSPYELRPGPPARIKVDLTYFLTEQGKTKPDDDADKHHGWVYRKPGDAPMTSPTGNGSFECDAALVPDMVTNVATVREVFELNGDTTGPFTTPLLWDNKDKRIVSNESTESKR